MTPNRMIPGQEVRGGMLDSSSAQQKFGDPSGGGPFEYRKTDGGFELQSKLTHGGKPVTLAVGTTDPD